MRIGESKILGKGDTGFGVLIEEDAGYIDRSLTSQFLKEGLLPRSYSNLLTEGFQIKENEPILVPCILQKWGVKNKNGRIYPEDVLVPEINRYITECVNNHSALAESNHADNSVVDLNNIAHGIRKMWWGNGENRNVLYGVLELITSPAYHKTGHVCMTGDKIAEYLRRGFRIGISSRGVGTLKEIHGQNIVQRDFELVCFDLVHSPSTPGAYLFPDESTNNLSLSEETKTILPVISEKHEKLIKKLDKFIL